MDLGKEELLPHEAAEHSFYEVWHGDRLLAYGVAVSGESVVVDIKASKIFFGRDSDPVEATGYQLLELYTFSLGESPRQTAKKSLPKVTAPDYTSEGVKYGVLRSIVFIKASFAV